MFGRNGKIGWITKTTVTAGSKDARERRFNRQIEVLVEEGYMVTLRTEKAAILTKAGDWIDYKEFVIMR